MDWSFQLYSGRNFQPWEKVIGIVADAGYRQVEGFGGLYDDPKWLKGQLDRHGLAMPTGHFGLDMLEGDFARAADIAGTLGMRIIICPYIDASLRPADAAGWRGFGERLAKVGEAAKRAGYEFAWHNHDFEFKKLPDGSIPLDHILEAAPDIGLEFDVAWCIRGGDVPWPVIDRYGKRLVAVHVKDIARPGEGADEDGWSDVGHGTVDWPRLMKEFRAKSAARYFVMEQDNPNDIERFARRSIEAARKF